MMPDQLARQEQIALRLEQSKRLLRGTHDPTTTERIGKLSVTSSMSKWKKKRSKAGVTGTVHKTGIDQRYG